MAQASSAQREPSMEEILASIRRIIEDSDVEKRREGDDVGAVIATPANDLLDRSKGVDAFRAEFRDVAMDEDEPQFAEPAISPVSRVVEPEHDMPVVDPVETAPEIVAVVPRAEHPAEAPDAGLVAPAELAFDEVAHALAEDMQAPAELPEADAASAADNSVGDVQPRPPLISERAGRQVAAAFGELSEAFAASRRRSFDEMAEEMLRPMLQDWLDNNLPHLVERLVREEIERIARG